MGRLLEPQVARDRGWGMSDRIVETAYGYDVIVSGQRFGTWRSKAEAAGGLAVEQRRRAEREEADSARAIACTETKIRDYHEWRNRDACFGSEP